MALKNGQRRENYRLVAERIGNAKRELVEGLVVARAGGLRWMPQLESRIGSLDALETKFTKASQA